MSTTFVITIGDDHKRNNMQDPDVEMITGALREGLMTWYTDDMQVVQVNPL